VQIDKEKRNEAREVIPDDPRESRSEGVCITGTCRRCLLEERIAYVVLRI